jgi:MFS family permease
MVVIAPFVSGLATRIGSRQVVVLGFVITTAGFAALAFIKPSWGYGTMVLPLVAMAVGMGLSNGCASAASTAAVSQNEVGAASGISNMARYVGASLLVAAAATIYGSAAGGSREELVTAVSRTSVLMTVASALGILVAVLYGRHRPIAQRPVDRAAAASVAVHTVPSPPALEKVGS